MGPYCNETMGPYCNETMWPYCNERLCGLIVMRDYGTLL